MNYNDCVIACDMDDTIEYLLPAWVEYLNKKYGYSKTVDDIVDFRMTLSYPYLSKEQIFEPLFLEDFWKTVEPMKDAIIYTKKLIEEGFPFYIVTSSHPDTLSYKLKHVLYKYFPFIDYHNVITTTKKQLIRCTIMIDDGQHNIVGPYYGLLMNASHNQNFNETDYENIKRVYNWEEIYENVHRIADAL